MDNPSTHPNPHPNLHHRKIDLQSAADLTYLQTLLAQSAREKLDRHLPPVAIPATHISLGGQSLTNTNTNTNIDTSNSKGNGNGSDRRESDTHLTEDDLRRAVRLLIDEYLANTWDSAERNIAVNGIDAAPDTGGVLPNCTNPTPAQTEREGKEEGDGKGEVEEREGVHFTYAAFDPRLQRRVASLHGELEALTAQVSRLRREAPGKAAGGYAERMRTAMERDESAWKGVLETETDTKEMEVGAPRQGWADVREVYEGGVDELAVLGTELTETVGRAQRAGRVAQELE